MKKIRLIVAFVILHSAISYAQTSLQELFDTMWESTKAAASTNGVREEGCFITLNTATGIYGVTAHTNGLMFAFPAVPYVDMLPTPADVPPNPSPIQSAIYVVGWFHTHTPMYYISDDFARAVGPSQDDKDYAAGIGLPGFVYDYIENGLGLWP